MKSIKSMSLVELAAFVQSHLRKNEIDVVLSGGASVTLYSSNKYISHDLDLINVHFVKRTLIGNGMAEIGFQEKGRIFESAETKYFVEFPDGPLSVGNEPVKEILDVKLLTGVLRVISPTDCVKDRLCAYYFWGDNQGLAQAILVAQNQKVDLKEIERWSKVESKLLEFQIFKEKLG